VWSGSHRHFLVETILKVCSNRSIQNDACIALSMDSTWRGACDCYQVADDGLRFKLEKCAQIASGPRGTCNVAIAASHDTVALYTKEGSYDGLLCLIVLGVLQIRFRSQPVLVVSRSHRGLRDGDPISIAFDDSGRRLLSLNHEVSILTNHANRRGILISTKSTHSNLDLLQAEMALYRFLLDLSAVAY
jgi:hypothetical protein